MADITNAEAVQYVNDRLHRRSEQIRAMLFILQDDRAKWNGGISANIPNDTSVVDDGREAEGVTRLTGADVNLIMARCASLLAVLEAQYAMDCIYKACVRAVDVNP
jgi:hypothetical protein